MPVSTFSPDHTARSHSGMISRWNSTRDRIDADERRRGMREMQELDGTDLYDRPDWPLSSPGPDEDEEQDQQRVKVQHGRVELEQTPAEEAAVVRRMEDIGELWEGISYTAEHEVSDIEDDNSEDDFVPDSHGALGRERLHKEHEQPRMPQQGSYEPPEVSPNRSDQASESSLSPALTPEQEPVHPIQPRLNGLQETEEDDEESGDIATPIPFAGSSTNSPELQQGTFTASPTNGTNPRNSIAKGPMHTPPHRRTSTRISVYNTAQIPHNKDRIVRYSWQSVQDDEHNRPRIHVIKLHSDTATASAGFPTGETLKFSISPGGRRIAAFNSARLYVLQTAALPVGISQDYALKRKPLAVELTDEGETMAILADDHTVNVYEVGHQLKRTRTIALNYPTNTIALAPTGGLLAATYEGGIEVFSLHPNALETDRRSVRCIKMDKMAFSEDGSTLLGTTTRINVSSTVVVSVPVFPSQPNGLPTHEELKEAWCSELLHPENIRNSSHAIFMREDRKTCNERLFAWNNLEDTFGILNVGDMQYGNIDFPVVISPPLSTMGGLGAAIHSCPAIDEHGDTVAMIVNDRTIRLYIVPHKAEDDATSLEAHSIDHELDEGYGCSFDAVRWVYSSSSLPAPLENRTQAKGRLVVTSPGGVTENGIGEESVEDIEGGRIILFDFDPQYAGQPGQTFSLTLGKSQPQVLEEAEMDVTEQVNLVRRRTVNQSRGGALGQRPATLGRSATTHGNRLLRSAYPPNGNIGMNRSRASMLSIGSMQSEAARSLPDLQESSESVEAMEEPYVQGAPRSHASLQRAASNAQRHRFQTLEERTQERVSVDSNGHFLALPEYTEEPNAPLPSRFRQMAGLDAPTMFNRPKPAVVTSVNGGVIGPSPSSSGPQTAPPDIGEGFSADMAFRVANANAAAAAESPVRETILERTSESRSRQSPISTSSSVQRSIGPYDSQSGTYNSFQAPGRSGTFDSQMGAFNAPSRAGTFDSQTGAFSPVNVPGMGAYESFSAMPRGLQRAYSNAVSPVRSGMPPHGLPSHLIGGPVSNPPSSSHSHAQMSMTGLSEDEPWDIISPVPPSNASTPSFGRPCQGADSYRYSTSLLNPPGHMPPNRASSSAGSFATCSTPSSARERRLPAHMQVFRNAAAANASASLFPPSQPANHVPLRQNTSKAGNVAHRITAWHPPAPSTPPPPASSHGTLRNLHHSRSHSRKSSSAGRSAFASTAKAKKLGFFKRSRKPDPWGPTYRPSEEGGSVMETKSMVTWMTKGEGKCVIM